MPSRRSIKAVAKKVAKKTPDDASATEVETVEITPSETISTQDDAADTQESTQTAASDATTTAAAAAPAEVAPAAPTSTFLGATTSDLIDTRPAGGTTTAGTSGDQPTTDSTSSDAEPAAATPVADPAPASTEAPTADAETSAAKETLQPAPMNVPVRPDNVKPAGPQLEKKQQVKLSGPKVVRVEAPEVVEAPRRRPPSDYGGGGGGGRGVGFGPGGGGGGGGDDGGRSPRRGGKRRGPGGREEPGRDGKKEGWSGGVFSEADLAEREARLQRSGGYLKQRRQLARSSSQGAKPQSLAQTGGKVSINAPFTIKDLSAATGVKAAEIVKKLFMQGVMATANSGIDVEKAQEILFEYEIELDVQEAKSAEDVVTEEFGQRDICEQRR